MNMRENPYYLSDPLWHRIEAYDLDDPGAIFPFSQKLAQQQQWSMSFAQKAIHEYKRFVYLCCTSSTGASPPTVVDEVWHLHLTYTVAYWQYFCRDTLHRELHHHPSRGGPEERDKHQSWYAATLRLYRQTFGEDPPADIWPPPVAPPASSAPDHTPLRKNYRLGTLLLILPFIYIIFAWHRWHPYHLKGPWFLPFYFLLIVCCLVQMLLSMTARRKILHNILRPVLPEVHAAGLAYLVNGTQGTLLYYISSLLQTGVLEWLEGDTYKLRRELLMASLPEHAVFRDETADTIKLGRVEKLLEPLVTAQHRTYMYLELEYRDVLCEYILPALVLMMGIARLVQGAINHRPVGFLVIEMILLCIGYAIISLRYGFHSACTRLLRADEALSSHITADLDRTVIFSGVAAVSALPLLVHLEHRFNPRSGGDGSGGGCGSSGCGSGCGGGCGGCGG